jgi:hypothetical protein
MASERSEERLGEILASCLTDLVLSLEAQPARLPGPPARGPNGDAIAAIADFACEGVRGSLTLLGAAQVFEKLHPVPAAGSPLDLADWARELANQAAGRLSNRLLSYDLAVAVGVPQNAPPAKVSRVPSTCPMRIPVVLDVAGPVLEAWLEVELAPGFRLAEHEAENANPAAREGDVMLF